MDKNRFEASLILLGFKQSSLLCHFRYLDIPKHDIEVIIRIKKEILDHIFIWKATSKNLVFYDYTTALEFIVEELSREQLNGR